MHPALIAATLLSIASASQATVVLCAKARPDGSFSTSVKIRSGSCRGNEQQLDPGPLGLQGLPGPGLVVKDGAGHVVGPVLSAASVDYTQVALQAGGVTIAVYIAANTIAQDTNLELSYESAACSGPLYMTEGGTLPPLPIGHVVGSVAYYRTGTPNWTLRQSAGRFAFDSVSCPASGGLWMGGMAMCCFDDPGFSYLSTVASFDLSPKGFVPPFAVSQP